MKKSEMKEYIRTQERVSIPTLQAQFSLRYLSLRKLFGEMERDGEIRLDSDGLNYRVVKRKKSNLVEPLPPHVADIAEDLEVFPPPYRQVVCFFAKVGRADAETLRDKLNIPQTTASNVLSWMEDVGVTKNGEFALSREDWQLLAKSLKRQVNPRPKAPAADEHEYYQGEIDAFLREIKESETAEEEKATPEEGTLEWWDYQFQEEMRKRHGGAPPPKIFRAPDLPPEEDPEDPKHDDPDPEE